MALLLIVVLMISTPGLKSQNSKGKFQNLVSEANNLDPVELVNPLMGTDTEFKLSNGNTYPAIALPWGMNFWTPQTRKMGDGWGYTYDDYRIQGIKQTHQPSPWINDYAAFSLMPLTGTLKFKGEERASWFSHKAEVSSPYYYSVYLADYDVTAELTPTERAAIFRFTFPESDSSFILLDAFFKGSMVKIDRKNLRIEGYCRNTVVEYRIISIITLYWNLIRNLNLPPPGRETSLIRDQNQPKAIM